MIPAEILTAVGGIAFTAAPAALLLRRAYDRLRELREAYELARFEATHDGLTGLANRRAFYEHAAHAVASVTRERPMALAVIDVNDFKGINDTHGHGIGDLVLLSVAHELAKRVPHGMLARLGGDEFVALAELERGESAQLFGEALADASDGVDVDDASVCVTFAVGVVELFEPASLGEALAWADEAMYRAKQTHHTEVVRYFRDDRPDLIPTPRRPEIRTRDLSVDEPLTALGGTR